jgi:FG-GAP-like repeat
MKTFLLGVLACCGLAFAQVPTIRPLNPPSVNPGTSFFLTVHGTGIGSQSQLLINGVVQGGSFFSLGAINAYLGPVSGAQTLRIQVKNTSGLVSNTFYLPIATAVPAGPGFLTSPVAIAGAKSPGPSVVADFNGDGIPDIATGDTTNNVVYVLLGQGNGTFTLASTVSALGSPIAVKVGDFNNDGNLVSGPNHCGNCVRKWEWNLRPCPESLHVPRQAIPGLFLFAHRRLERRRSTGFAVGTDTGMFVFSNSGSGASFTSTEIYTGYTINGAFAGDFNNDGRSDSGHAWYE